MTDIGPSTQLKEDDRQAESLDYKTANPSDLLVKAWEEKVFPVIRRRFRNEADRRSGLEQIRGALQAGESTIGILTDIIMQQQMFLRSHWSRVDHVTR